MKRQGTWAKWRATHPEQSALAKREWNRLHAAEWRAANKDKVRASRARYREGHRDVLRRSESRRNLRMTQAGGQLRHSDVAHLLPLQDNRCSYCRADISAGFEIDHRNPISRGGTNAPENLHLVCPPCSREKGARTHEEYLAFRVNKGGAAPNTTHNLAEASVKAVQSPEAD